MQESSNTFIMLFAVLLVLTASPSKTVKMSDKHISATFDQIHLNI